MCGLTAETPHVPGWFRSESLNSRIFPSTLTVGPNSPFSDLRFTLTDRPPPLRKGLAVKVNLRSEIGLFGLVVRVGLRVEEFDDGTSPDLFDSNKLQLPMTLLRFVLVFHDSAPNQLLFPMILPSMNFIPPGAKGWTAATPTARTRCPLSPWRLGAVGRRGGSRVGRERCHQVMRLTAGGAGERLRRPPPPLGGGAGGEMGAGCGMRSRRGGDLKPSTLTPEP